MMVLQSMERKAFHKVNFPNMTSEVPDRNYCEAPEQ